MRTDVSVEQHKKLYPVKDVSGRTFIVADGTQLVSVPMVGEPHQIEFGHALTLARASASLTNLVTERAYTPWSDPRMKRQRDAVTAEAAMGDKASLAEGKMIAAMSKGYVLIDSQSSPASAAAQDAESRQAAADAFQAMNMAEEMRSSNITSGAFAQLAAENDMREERFDAVSIRFTVSSENFLEKPYLVAITRFHTKDDKPGEARNAVYARALESIGSKPTNVDVLQGGMPPGFELEEVQVHLYDNGREIPTEVSPKCVPLSRDDAFEYLKIEYLAGHKGDTLPAVAALGRPTREQQLQLTPNQWKADYYVKVSRDGVPQGTYTDEACSQPVDGLVAELAGNVRYYPALDKGRLVDGTARLSLRQLQL
ncbi:MAG TPA: hypothetical protein VHD61_11375 [Lacunisphaera sp.]|nr:hypothetical protein [Lacunisphaera sp.]